MGIFEDKRGKIDWEKRVGSYPLFTLRTKRQRRDIRDLLIHMSTPMNWVIILFV